jgi:hypothetical protein
MRSIFDNVICIGLVGPVFQTGAAVTTSGDIVDTLGYNTAAIRVFATPISGLSSTQLASLTAVLYEGSVSTTLVVANDNTGTPIGFTLSISTVAAIQLPGSTNLGQGAYIGSARVEGLGLNRKRYLQLRITSNSLASYPAGGAYTTVGVIELGRAYNTPVDLIQGGVTPVSNT